MGLSGKRKLRTYFWATQDNGCGKYRVWSPAAALKKQKLTTVRREPDQPLPISADRALEIYTWADVIVTQPFTEPLAACILVAARDRCKKKLVVDLDDDIWAIHPLNVGAVDGKLAYIASQFDGKFDRFWELKPVPDEYKREKLDEVLVEVKGRPFILRPKAPDAKMACEFILSHADAITTTNPVLAAQLTKMTGNKNVHVLPNCLDLTEWATPVLPPRKEVWLGWCGSVSHYPDLEPLVPALDELMARYPQLRVQIMGSSFDYLFPVNKEAQRFPVEGYMGGGEEPLFTANYDCTGERWPGRMQFNRPVPIQQYVNWMSSSWRSDIGIAPILDSDFNAAKSELKWTEYAALGAPTVASKVGPYKRAIKHDKDGKLCGSIGAWKAGLSELIECPEKRYALTDAARERLFTEYNIDKQAHRWASTYESVCAS